VTDLRTTYLGLELAHPLVASPSPLSYTLEGIRRLADAGVSAIVLHSLFEEEVRAQSDRQARLVEAGSESFAESLTYFPAVPGADAGPRQYLSLLERARASIPIPVIGSLNGVTTGGWTAAARQLQDAGASAIELNLYSAPVGPEVTGRAVEERHVEVLGLVKASVGVPVAVKMSPYYSSVGEMARRFVEAGADGLVLFNRFLHPDIDPESFALVPGIGLSTPAEGRLARTWIALLRRRLDVALAATTGVEGPEDLARYLLAGADVVMSTSALLRHGLDHVAVLLEGLRAWMARKGFGRLEQLRGLLAAPAGVGDAGARADYVAAMQAANASTTGPW